jgi:hypothetical protein
VLSLCEEWGAEDGQFILKDFYDVILELFSDEEDEWVIEMLAYFPLIFGHRLIVFFDTDKSFQTSPI